MFIHHGDEWIFMITRLCPIKNSPLAQNCSMNLEILGSAERLVIEDTELTKRVQKVFFHYILLYFTAKRFFGIDQNGVFIKQNKNWVVREEIRTKLQYFLGLLGKLEITQLNESGLSPKDYEAEWKRIFDAGPIIHKALNKPLRLLTESTPEFVSKGAEEHYLMELVGLKISSTTGLGGTGQT